MKKKAISFLTAFLTAISCTATMLPTITRTAIAASTSNVKFDEDEFYVAVGTCKGATQLRYFAQKSDGGYTVEKVVWEDAPVDISYGDVFIGDGNIEMTKVMAAPDNPVYAMAYYYQLDDGAKLNKVGKCDDLMEKKVLTVSSKTYDGSAHWSIRYKDSDGKEYYYGLSNFASTLTVDPLDCEVGDVYTYALCNDYMVIPLAKENDISDVYAEPEYKIVKLPDKVEYKVGESISLNGIQVEVKKGNEEPIVYTYPDVAFDYQSNIPKAPSVILHSDFRSDKAGTYKVEVVGADNLSFDVKVVDDSTIKDLAAFEEGETMTIDDVIELSKKGNALTLNDLAKFKGVIAGSGIFILEYDLGKGYTLMVGSMTLEKIDYARLRYSGSENFIDIRTDDVEKYLSTSAEVSNIKGDANCDGQVDLSDAVMIMQALANPDKYGIGGTAEHHLTEQGKLNGDMNGDGLTVGDGLAIQRKLLGLDNDEITDSDRSAISGKIFAYEKEGAGGYCTLSFNENGRFLYSPGKISSYMGGGDWKIDGDTVSLIGMENKTIYLKITDDTLVYIAEGSDEFPYMDIKGGEKFGIYRPEISSDKFQLNSRYSEYGLDNPKVELNLIASELPEFCYVDNVRLYDEDDNFIGNMSPAMDANIWSYLVDCHVTEECSKTFYTLTKIRCGEKTYLDDVRSEITVNFKDTPAPKIDNSEYLFGNEPSGSVMTPQRLALNCNSFCANGETLNVKMLMGDKYTYNQEHNSYPNYDSEGYPEYSIFATENFKKLDDERLIINGKKSEFTKIFSKDDMKSLDISQKEGDYSSYYNDTAEIDFSNYASGSTGCISFRFGWKADGENPLNPKSDFTGTSQTMYFYVGENGTGISINGAEAAKKAYDEKSDIDIMFYDSPYVKWNDKEVMSNLYEKLRKPNNEKLAINFKLSPSPDYDYKYNGKTLAEYANADYTEEMDKLRDLLMYGNQLQYGENLYTTGMPDGTKRTKEWYDERVEYFGKEILSKYIVDGIFLEETLRSDINELMKKHRSDYSEAEKAYYRYIADKAIKQLDEQNIKYEYMTDPKRLVIYVTADEFKSLTIDNVSRYGLDTSVASGITVDAVF